MLGPTALHLAWAGDVSILQTNAYLSTRLPIRSMTLLHALPSLAMEACISFFRSSSESDGARSMESAASSTTSRKSLSSNNYLVTRRKSTTCDSWLRDQISERFGVQSRCVTTDSALAEFDSQRNFSLKILDVVIGN